MDRLWFIIVRVESPVSLCSLDVVCSVIFFVPTVSLLLFALLLLPIVPNVVAGL